MDPRLCGAGGENEKMDRWIESPWVLRILALFLAILLYMSVNVEEVDLKKKTENVPNDNVATIEDVPVDVYYDSDNLVVSGVPQTVSVTIEGPKSIVQSTKALKDFKVYVDLSNLGVGTHDVPIKYDNISNQLKVKIEPAYAEVSIQEKVTKEFKVGAEISDGMLGNGYQVDSLSVSPKTVEITGAKDVINQIAYVKATLDSDELIDGEFTGKARVRVLDSELNKLDVAVDPETVEVTVKVKNPNKKVPVSVKEIGNPPEGVSIKDIDIDPKEVTVYGKESALDKLNNVEINIDLSKIKRDTVKEVPIHLKEGLNYVSPQKVKVVVSVDKRTKPKEDENGTAEITPDDNQTQTNDTNSPNSVITKTIADIPIETRGLSDDYVLDSMSPSTVNAEVTGEESVVDKLSKDDFSLYIDLSGLTEGEHQLKIEGDGPNNTDWKLSDDQVNVQLSVKKR